MKATDVTAGLAESNDLLPGLWRDSLHVTCGLTACTPGSAPGPSLYKRVWENFTFTFLQGTVAAYLRFGGVVNNQIKKGLLLSLRLKKMVRSVNIWQSYKQERDCLMHSLRLSAVCWPGAQSA